MLVYVHIYQCVQAPGGQKRPVGVLLYHISPIPLRRQGRLLTMALGWRPESLSDPPACASHSFHSGVGI